MKFETRATKEQRERFIRYKQVFGSGEGRTVLMELMNRFHILSPHDGDPYKEGQRSAILFILNQSKVNLEAYDKLLEGKDAEV